MMTLKIYLMATFVAMGMVALVVILPFALVIAMAGDPILKAYGMKGFLREGGKHVIMDKTSFEAA